MLGFEALGVFALGQGEPWTLKGKQRFIRREGRGKQPTYYDEPKPIAAKAPRKARKPKVELPPPLPQPIISPEFRALLQTRLNHEAARLRDEEEAIIALLTAA